MARTWPQRTWSALNVLFPLRSQLFVFLMSIWLLFMAISEYFAFRTGSNGTFGLYEPVANTFEDVHPARVQQFVLVMSAAIYWGVYRAFAFNPFYRNNYSAFLKLSPWRLGKRLPLGPLRLTIVDAAVGIVLSLLVARSYPIGWAFPVVGGLAAYALPTILMMYMIGATGWFFALAFALASFPYALDNSIAQIVWIVLVAVLSNGAVHASLRSFPWNDTGAFSVPRDFANVDLNQWFQSRKRRSVRPDADGGWPLGSLSPSGAGGHESYGMKMAWCALVGWSVAAWAPVDLSLNHGLGDYISICVIALPLYGFARSGRFWTTCASPIGFFGRIFTLRWIIPRFDIVFIPAVAGSVWAVGATIAMGDLDRFGPWQLHAVIFCLVAGGSAFIAFSPPRTRRWRLTGGYRSRASRSGQLRQL